MNELQKLHKGACAMMGIIIIVVLSLQLMTMSMMPCTICSSAPLLLIWSV